MPQTTTRRARNIDRHNAAAQSQFFRCMINLTKAALALVIALELSMSTRAIGVLCAGAILYYLGRALFYFCMYIREDNAAKGITPYRPKHVAPSPRRGRHAYHNRQFQANPTTAPAQILPWRQDDPTVVFQIVA